MRQRDGARRYAAHTDELAARIAAAIHLCPRVEADRSQMLRIATLSIEAGVDGHRADIVMLKAAKAHAAYQGRGQIESSDIDLAAQLVLPHRMRRQPLQALAPAPTSAR